MLPEARIGQPPIRAFIYWRSKVNACVGRWNSLVPLVYLGPIRLWQAYGKTSKSVGPTIAVILYFFLSLNSPGYQNPTLRIGNERLSVNTIPQDKDPFRRLVAIMARLRGPGGCPWDREQTHESLKQYLLEESHEVFKAIDERDDEELRLELGDVALQVVFHAEIAREEGRFDIDDVLNGICDKLIHRHPHVFSDTKADTAEEVLNNWEKIKKKEKANEQNEPSALDGVPKTLPALHRTQRIQSRAAHVGFDWDSPDGAFEKIQEEIGELKAAIESGNKKDQAAELGDLLFSIVNFARLSNFRAEEILIQGVEKFECRFRAMEKAISEKGKEMTEMSLEELDAVWDEMKSGD